MKSVHLIQPTLTFQPAIQALKYAFITHGYDHIAGSRDLMRFDDEHFTDWLNYVAAPRGTNLFGWEKVSDSTYLIQENEDKQIVGILNIRHELNDYLRKFGGHIGYAINPSAWGQGYATAALAQALRKTDELGISEVLITCDSDNLASEKVIRKNGGIFQQEYVLPNHAKATKSFIIFRPNAA